jgi:hypothetical protein
VNASPASPRWIVSAPFDLALVGVPALATLLAFALPASDDVPLWAFLVFVVAFDVAHVWSTLYLGYVDGEAFARRRWLFVLPVPVTILVGYRLHLHDPTLFWTLMAYVAIHHFASQQWGFVALYKARAGERGDRYLDKWTLWVGALTPVLWWHASPELSFDWFGHGERFLLQLDPGLKVDLAAVWLGVAAVYLGRQAQLARQGRLNVGKNVWMLASWASWSVGVAWVEHPLVALAAINLLHGIPFLALVWVRLNRRWEGRPGAPGTRLLAWLSQRKHVWACYGVVLALALGEEYLWEALVWGGYVDTLWSVEALDPRALSLCVALLATPQVVHYYLDAWLWKLDGTNPDLKASLRL